MADVYFDDAWINTNPDREKWIRVDPETGRLYRYNSGNGQYDIALPIAIDSIIGLTDALSGKSDTSHTHTSIDDIELTGDVDMTDANVQIKNLNITSNLFMDGDNGANADITVGGYHLVVKEGIVTTLVAV